MPAPPPITITCKLSDAQRENRRSPQTGEVPDRSGAEWRGTGDQLPGKSEPRESEGRWAAKPREVGPNR